MSRPRRTLRLLPMMLLLIAALACSMPAIVPPAPSPTVAKSTLATPPATLPPVTAAPSTPTRQPFPPSVVESSPPQDTEIPLQGPITLYFNQPMDRASVESAVALQGTGGQAPLKVKASWKDDHTLSFSPEAPLAPASQVTLLVSGAARSQFGLALSQPFSLTFRTSDYLTVTQVLPAPNASEVDPSSAIVATFSSPVVPLGGDPASLPAGFTITPTVDGRGSWINTSTYIYYPNPAMAGGRAYSATVNPGLHSLDGSPLKETTQWGFTTAMPRIVEVRPDGKAPARLDTPIVLTFNQAMDPVDVSVNFSLQSATGPVPGSTAWNDLTTVMTYTPATLLERDTPYWINLSALTKTAGGTALGSSLSSPFRTVPQFAVSGAVPAAGSQLSPGESPGFFLTAPPTGKDITRYITSTPHVSNLSPWWDEEARILRVFGDYYASATYTLTLSPDLPDAWGGTLGQAKNGAPYVFSFRTAPLPAGLTINSLNDVLFLTPQDASLPVQATNVSSLNATIGSVTLADFYAMFGENGYELRRNYRPADQRTWQQTLSLPPDQTQTVNIFLSPDQQPLPPGVYALRLPISGNQEYPYLLIVSNIQLTFKLGEKDALVWAVDLRTSQPLANAPVTILDENGKTLAGGITDAQGIFKSDIPARHDLYTPAFALLGQPGQENFSLAYSTWTFDPAGMGEGIRSNYAPTDLMIYLYSDRPIYRPGQTVYFRAIVRQAYNGRYSLPDLGKLPLVLMANGQTLASFELPLDGFGSGHGEYTLPPEAMPGYYSLGSSLSTSLYFSFQVSNYRKPEINLQVAFAPPDEVLAGQNLTATVNARYFFDAPAGNAPLHWILYAKPGDFALPGYHVGREDTRYLDPFPMGSGQALLGAAVAEGNTRTGADGKALLSLPTQAGSERLQLYTLEVTVTDESGLPVATRVTAKVHPAPFYIGLKADEWLSNSSQQASFAVKSVRWDQSPAGGQSLHADFQKVTWVRTDPSATSRYPFPTFTAQYTPVGSTDFQTSDQGEARLAFTPTEPGNYLLSVTGGGASSGMIYYVIGPGQTAWPDLTNHRLHLAVDRDGYHPGDTAQIFIPNPFGAPGQALLTVERGKVMRQTVFEVEAGGSTQQVPLSGEDAPNVYVAVTLLGKDTVGLPDVRQGIVELPVAPISETLNVKLSAQPTRAGPGDEVKLDLLVTDAAGQPVQGEFSVAAVDLAVLALAEPNSADILPAFYGPQPLGIRTNNSLAAAAFQRTFNLGGMGGGGGDMAPQSVARENLPDTAYWNAEVVTGSDGKAQVSVRLPDNLTTWQVDVRGVTADTRVGQGRTRIVTSRELLVRPVTPRFLVAGDHALLAAVVQNNTNGNLQATVTLQTNGFSLDDPARSTQTVSVPAGGRARVEWWGTAQDVESLDATMSAQAGSLQDAVRLAGGKLPIHRYFAQQAFRTSGVLDQAGQRTEQINLPVSFDPKGGSLTVELEPSLAAAMLAVIQAQQYTNNDSTEATLSYFLPNVELYRALKDFGIQSPLLENRLRSFVSQGVDRLYAGQNPDGGLSWWPSPNNPSDPYVTAYVVFGLLRAREAGFSINQDNLNRALDYLQNNVGAPTGPAQTAIKDSWQLDQLTLEYYALALGGRPVAEATQSLYNVRDQLSPWGRAFLALALAQADPNSEQAKTLVSDLEATAVRSASGAYWDLLNPGYQSMVSTLTNTAIVAYALAQRDPGAPVLADTVRFLMVTRKASGWTTTYTTAWTLLALNAVMKGTGELGGDFSFTAFLNDSPIASGQASGPGQYTPVSASVPLANLAPDAPNLLQIQRQAGPGRLYYTADLNISRPVDSVPAVQNGLSLARTIYPTGDCSEKSCTALQAGQAGQRVSVHLTLNAPHDQYYLLLEDYIPAGAEILDMGLKTAEIGPDGAPVVKATYNPRSPWQSGWGSWFFLGPRLYDDHISWAASYLPAGTYELTYTLVLLQPGEYRLLPANAWLYYFPDTRASTAGAIFTIQP